MNVFEMNTMLCNCCLILTVVSWVLMAVVLLDTRTTWQQVLILANASTVFSILAAEESFLNVSLVILEIVVAVLLLSLLTRIVDRYMANNHRCPSKNSLWAFYVFICVSFFKMDVGGEYITYCLDPKWYNYRKRHKMHRGLTYKQYQKMLRIDNP